MALKPIPFSIVLDAGGGTIDLPTGVSSDPATIISGLAGIILISGDDTLSSSWTIQSSGTAAVGVTYKFLYYATMALDGNNITIMGQALTQEQANLILIIESTYDGSDWITTINRAENPGSSILGLTAPTTTALTAGGGTITINPLTDNRTLQLNGSGTLAGSWTVNGSGDNIPSEFYVFYKGNWVVGANAITIFGAPLTPTEALLGDTSFFITRDVVNNAYIVSKQSSQAQEANISFSIYARVDELRGNNGTAIVNRFDLPFATVAAANTAVVALSPTSTNPALIEFTSAITTGFVVKDAINYQTNGYPISLSTGNGQFTITDDGVAAGSKIFGYSNIIRDGTGTTPVGCISFTDNSSVTMEVGSVSQQTAGASDAAILINNGSALINIEISGAIESQLGKGVVVSFGELNLKIKNSSNGISINSLKSCIQCGGGIVVAEIEDYLCGELSSATVYPIECSGTGSVFLIHRNGIYTNPNAPGIYYNSSEDIKVISLGETPTAQKWLLSSGAAATGRCEIMGGKYTTSGTVGMFLTGTATYYIHDLQIKTTGTNANVIEIDDTPTTQAFKNLVLETNGTGKSFYSANAVDSLNYVGVIANKAVDVNVTEVGGATTVNASVIVI